MTISESLKIVQVWTLPRSPERARDHWVRLAQSNLSYRFSKSS